MTDAVREQIARDAAQWWARNDGPTEDPDGLFEDAYIDGATHQHHIAFQAGRKEAIDEMIAAITARIDGVDSVFALVHVSIIKELEALKR